MPKLQPAQQQSPEDIKPYGVSANENSMTFQERMMRRFAAHEYVEVRNIDDEALVWQYLPQHEEDFRFADNMKITSRGEPEMWMVEGGESEVLVGACAYLMLDALYKKVTAKTVLRKPKDGKNPDQPRNFNYSDGNQQELFLDKAFVGKAQPMFSGQEQPIVGEDAQAKMDQIADKAKDAAKKTVGVS